jgi:hypothetical protein
VTAFRTVIAVAPEPLRVVEHFETLWGGSVSGDAKRARLQIGSATLEIYTSEVLRKALGGAASPSATPALVGAALTVTDRDALIRWMQPQGLINLGGGRACLPASRPCGCVLVFLPPEDVDLL